MHQHQIKQFIREQIRGARKACSSYDRDIASQKISQQLAQTDFFHAASIIFLYAALPYEVQTTLIAQEARKQGKQVAYPKTCSEDYTMAFYIVESEEDLESYRCGKMVLKEPNPKKHQKVIPDEKTLVILPGMAFDRHKNRLGYGGGYYDRYLEQYEPKTVGIAFDFSIVETLPVEPFDRPLDYLITETRVWR